MAFINTIPACEATGEVLELYQRQQGGLDYLPNYARVFSHRPLVMRAWAELQRAIRQQLDARSFGLITLAAAMAIGSSYCSLAHARKLVEQCFTPAELTAILRGEKDSPLSDAEKAMMCMARKVALDSSTVTQVDIDALKEAGFCDAQIFDIVAAAAGRCFFAKVPDALGALPDAPLGELTEPLRTLLTVGRPIAVQQQKSRPFTRRFQRGQGIL